MALPSPGEVYKGGEPVKAPHTGLIMLSQPNSPESKGMRVEPTMATPAPATSCFMPWDFDADIDR